MLCEGIMTIEIEGEYPDYWTMSDEIRHYIAMKCFSKLTSHLCDYDCHCSQIFEEFENLNILNKIEEE